MKKGFFKKSSLKLLFIRVFFVILILILYINLSACSTFSDIKDYFKEKFSAEDDMKRAVDTVNEFFELLKEKNYREAYRYLSSKDKEKGGFEDFVNEFRDVTGIVSVDIKWVEVKGNIAVVCLDLTDFYDGDEKVYRDIEVSLLREEDESWKIVFWK